jgi:hypothetical protein
MAVQSSLPILLTLTLVIAGGFLVAGIACCILGTPVPNGVGFTRSLGLALLSSGAIALTLAFLQFLVDDAAQTTRDAEAREVDARLRQAESFKTQQENFRIMFSLSPNLTGFTTADIPEGLRLEDLSFSGKTLAFANLNGKNLANLQFQDSALTAANFEDADLSGANLLGADFTDAELTGADLSGADLKSARFEHAAIEQAKSLKGAEVNAQTCWPQAFLEKSPHAVGLETSKGVISTKLTAANGMFGHTCTEEPTMIFRTTVTPEADGSFVADPPVPGARVDYVDWLPTPTGQNAIVTWMVEN